MYFGYITTVYGVLRIKYYFSIILYGNGCEYVVLQNNRYVLLFFTRRKILQTFLANLSLSSHKNQFCLPNVYKPILIH
jgi:hypothetical protein